MLLVSSTQKPARELGPSARGAVAAFIAGAVGVLVGGRIDHLRLLLAEPPIAALGLLVACGTGALLARRVIRARLSTAIAFTLAYGVVVPAVVAAVVALPVAPIAVGLSVLAWPVTIPAALAWLALLRWARSHDRLRSFPIAGLVCAFATVLLALGFTQPATSVSAARAQCLSFPGERIGALAWSPDGEWLGLGSESDAEGIVRVIEWRSGRVIELARGPYIQAASSGIAVGPGGATTYLLDAQGASVLPQDEDWSLWTASPSESSHRLADLPTPALFNLTWTSDGIAAVQTVDPTTWTEVNRLVWVRPDVPVAEALEPIQPERILRQPVLAPLVAQGPGGAMVIRTRGGDRKVAWPTDASGEVSVTGDGAFLVFHARALTADGERELYSHLVAQSTETAKRVVLAEEETWDPHLVARRVAYLTFPAFDGNSVCVKDVPTN